MPLTFAEAMAETEADPTIPVANPRGPGFAQALAESEAEVAGGQAVLPRSDRMPALARYVAAPAIGVGDFAINAAAAAPRLLAPAGSRMEAAARDFVHTADQGAQEALVDTPGAGILRGAGNLGGAVLAGPLGIPALAAGSGVAAYDDSREMGAGRLASTAVGGAIGGAMAVMPAASRLGAAGAAKLVAPAAARLTPFQQALAASGAQVAGGAVGGTAPIVAAQTLGPVAGAGIEAATGGTATQPLLDQAGNALGTADEQLAENLLFEIVTRGRGVAKNLEAGRAQGATAEAAPVLAPEVARGAPLEPLATSKNALRTPEVDALNRAEMDQAAAASRAEMQARGEADAELAAREQTQLEAPDARVDPSALVDFQRQQAAREQAIPPKDDIEMAQFMDEMRAVDDLGVAEARRKFVEEARKLSIPREPTFIGPGGEEMPALRNVTRVDPEGVKGFNDGAGGLPEPAGLPRPMRKALQDAGYTAKQLADITPAQAEQIVAAKRLTVKRPEVEEAPAEAAPVEAVRPPEAAAPVAEAPVAKAPKPAAEPPRAVEPAAPAAPKAPVVIPPEVRAKAERAAKDVQSTIEWHPEGHATLSLPNGAKVRVESRRKTTEAVLAENEGLGWLETARTDPGIVGLLRRTGVGDKVGKKLLGADTDVAAQAWRGLTRKVRTELINAKPVEASITHDGETITIVNGGWYRLAHEVGHRQWYKQLTGEEKAALLKAAKFDGDAQSGAAAEAAQAWLDARHREIRPFASAVERSLFAKAKEFGRKIVNAARAMIGLPPMAEAPKPLTGEQVYERMAKGEVLRRPDRPADAVEPGKKEQFALGGDDGLTPAARAFVEGLSPEIRKAVEPDVAALKANPDPAGDLANLKMSAEMAQRKLNKAPRYALANDEIAKQMREKYQSGREPDTVAGWEKEARAIVDAPDAQAKYEALRARVVDGDGLSAVEMRALDYFTAKAIDKANEVGSLPAYEAAMSAARLRHEAGTNPAQALRAMGEIYNTDTADGRRNVILQNLAPTDYMADKIRAAETALKKARTRRKNGNGTAEAVLAAEMALADANATAARRMIKIREKMQEKYGIDLMDPNVGERFNTRYALQQLDSAVAKENWRENGTLGDLISNQIRANMLFSTGTQVVNAAGAINAKRVYLRETIAALAKGDPATAAKWAPHILPFYTALHSSMTGGRAFQAFKDAWNAGYDVHQDAVGAGPTGPDMYQVGSVGKHRANIPTLGEVVGDWFGRKIAGETGGEVGRRVVGVNRYAFRLMGAVDAMLKSINAHAAVTVRAGQRGRGEGLDGEALEAHIREALDNPQDPIWKDAYQTAREIQFQDLLDKHAGNPDWMQSAVEGVTRAANRLGSSQFGSVRDPVRIAARAVTVPTSLLTGLWFIGTPLAIKRQGARLLAPVQATSILLKALTGRGEYLKSDRIRQDLGDLLIGAAIMAGVAGLVSGDDNKTRITGAPGYRGSAAQRAESAGAAPPPFSFKVGNTWHSYAGIEPMASTLGSLVNVARGWTGDPDRASTPQMTTDAISSTFLPQFMDFMDAMHAMTTNEGQFREMMAKQSAQTAVNLVLPQAAVIAPKLVRAVVDDDGGKRARFGKGTTFGEKVIQASGFDAPPVSVDVYGRDVKLAGNGGRGEVAAKMLVRVFSPEAHNPLVYDERLLTWNAKANRAIDEAEGDEAKNLPKPYVADLPNATFGPAGAKVTLKGAEYRQYAKAVGQRFREMLDASDLSEIPVWGEKEVERYRNLRERAAMQIRKEMGRD